MREGTRSRFIIAVAVLLAALMVLSVVIPAFGQTMQTSDDKAPAKNFYKFPPTGVGGEVRRGIDAWFSRTPAKFKPLLTLDKSFRDKLISASGEPALR
jgi:hypothetical protein